MRKYLLGALALIYVSVLCAGPDEGMWLPLYLKQMNEKDMQAKGLKLTAEDIYSINQSSLKDAVVRMGNGFCTGEIVSGEGLMLTNHHCGYDAIAELSSVAQNYLDNGFWAKTRAEEISAPGLTISILVRMEDVSKPFNALNADETDPRALAAKMQELEDSLTKAAVAGTHYDASIESFFGGNEYYLMVYETFKDVRLVGTPPDGIGKFGGDQDNWMWPRHTGDFSVFRIYAGKDNKPADYSADNVPYKPKKFFQVFTGGLKEGDYTMIMGFPGSTDRYLSSYELEMARDYVNPAAIAAFGSKLETMKKDMDADPELSLALASEYASLSNSHKYFIGQQGQLKQLDLIDMRKKEEQQFTEWVNANDERKKKYGEVLPTLKESNEKMKTVQPGMTYVTYGLFSAGAIQYSFTLFPIYQASQAGEIPKEAMDSIAQAIKPATDAYLQRKSGDLSQKILANQLVLAYHNIPEAQRPAFLNDIVSNHKNCPTPEDAINTYVSELYENSFMLNASEAEKFYKKPKYKKVINDPLYKLMSNVVGYYFMALAPVQQMAGKQESDAHKTYIAALREWKSNEKFYPDANSTLRVTYGNVMSYFPRDAVFYDYYTTYQGILEKNNPTDPEFDAPDDELSLLKQHKFGKYAQNDTLRINFLSNNDITGGNSGSPVLDAHGRLVGIAFDGNWESMIGDLYVDPALNRTISVDIRYVLWVMDTLSGAGHLVKEMTVVEK